MKANIQAKDIYVIDSGATVHIFNKKPNKNFEFSSSQSSVEGIGQEKIAIGEEDNVYIGRYLIIPQVKVNLISVNELMKNGIQVHFSNDQSFIQTKHNVYILKQSSDGLYFIRQGQFDGIIQDQMQDDNKDYAYQLTVNTDGSDSFTSKQKFRASEIHKLHYSLGHPSNQALKNMLKYGLIINTALVPGDVDIYEKIYGRCPHCIEGKVNAPSYSPSQSETVNIIGGRIHMDLKPLKESQVDGGHLYMIISVDQYSGYLHAVTCKSKLTEDVLVGFNEIVAWYKSYKHVVREVMSDSEQTFKSLETDIRMLGINPFYTTPYQHAQRVERYIQTINKRMNSIIASLPYVLPHRLYGELIYEVVNNINMAPNHLHPTQTPLVMFMGMKYDQLIHKKPAFGTPAMFHQVGKEINPRSQLGIVLSYVIASKGHQVRAWIISDNRIKIRSHYMIVKAYPRDLKFPFRVVSVQSHLPDYFEASKTTTIQSVKTSNDSVGLPSNSNPKRIRLDDDPISSLTAGHSKVIDQDAKIPVANSLSNHENPMVDADDDAKMSAAVTDVFVREIADDNVAKMSAAVTDVDMVDVDVDDVDNVQSLNSDSEMKDVQKDDVSRHPIHSNIDVGIDTNLRGHEIADINSISIPTITRSGRIVKPSMKATDKAFITSGDLTIKQALSGPRPEAAKRAILDEVRNMIQYAVGYFVHPQDIADYDRRNIIRAFGFVKEKYKPNGEHDKTKARLVVNGKHQPDSTYEDLSSSTVDLSSVFLLFNVASYLRCDITCYDIKGAFLNAPFEEKDPTIYIRLSADIVEFWQQIDPTILTYIADDGSVIMKLAKYLYGLKQSPLKFQEHLEKNLTSIDYNHLVMDQCLYVKRDEDRISMLSTHVDDIMNVSNDEQLTSILEDHLRKVYKDISKQSPATSYLGIDIKRGEDKRDIYLSQPKLVNDILTLDQSDAVSVVPSTAAIYENPSESQPISKKKYLSITMKIMYLARMTRPDLLFATTYLASKCQNPTSHHYKQVIRLIRYIRYTKDQVLHIHCDDLNSYLYTDASYASHSDGRSHTGYVLTLGNNRSYLHAVSVKQKVGSSSSTDAEIIAVQTSIKYLKWIRQLIYELDVIDIQPTIVFQDNRSVIMICTSDDNSVKRVKHLLSKISFIRSMRESNEIKILYLKSDEMTADIFTKPLSSHIFGYHRKNLGLLGSNDRDF